MPSPMLFQTFSPALLPGESRQELEALLEAYFKDFRPQTITEEHSLCEMVDAIWRLRRTRRHVADVITADNARAIARFRNHEAYLQRIHDRAFRNLLRSRRYRRLESQAAITAKAKR